MDDLFYYRFLSFIKILLKFGVNCGIHKFKLFRRFNYISIPKTYNIIQLKLSNWNSEKDSWGKSLEDRLYHYRGSFNYRI